MSMMSKADIADKFYSLTFPSYPNDWEVEEICEELSTLSRESCEALLSHIPSVWPVSHSLCFAYLKYGSGQFDTITLELLPEWVRWLLSRYEAGGLREAELFMADAAVHFIEKLQSTSEVRLEEITRLMSHYIHGVSGKGLVVEADEKIWSDTETIFLPPSINIFSDKTDNMLLYKFLISYQWSLISLKSNQFIEDVIEQDPSGKNDVFIRGYLFCKGINHIRKFLPGLWKRAAKVIVKQLKQEKISPDGQEMEELLQSITEYMDSPGHEEKHLLHQFFLEGGLSQKEFEQFKKLFAVPDTVSLSPVFGMLLGHFNTSKTRKKIEQIRTEQKDRFVSMLSQKIPESSGERNDNSGNELLSDDGVSVLTISKALENPDQKKEILLRINNQNVVLPQELLDIALDIVNDFGRVPEAYIQAAVGIAGHGAKFGDGVHGLQDTETVFSPETAFVFDEWDCRRGGYRKDWCTLIEEELPVQRSNFIEQTLGKYFGLRKQLQRQFEMMRTAHRFLGRQKDGDELDLDAITDAIGDRMAGKIASDRLFIRLQRDERSIATLFLVDMSNSTSGWIGNMIKESLVLLSEAMETLGDQYGIYGFSGMKRSRCKLYPIKDLSEPYTTAVQDRIAAIGPKDYTRMAPPIRHLTNLLGKTDVKTRLLISLSDGKPEDYDGYHGTYAIEDTKKALLEARGKGITPFCITIDKQAHDYLEHMYGQGNFCFINNIESLPSRMPQIYRNLTR